MRGIDLSVQTGEVFALLGPNGAGKTTTVEIMEGHRPRSGGEVSVLGFDPGSGQRAFKQRIGIVLQETGVEPYLTVQEAIALYGGYYPAPLPVDQIIELVGLSEKRNARVVQLSGGQKRRLDVAIGLAGDPDLLFLDEPTTGFDPSARRQAWEMVLGLKRLGKTVFLTTHYMDEAQALADRVAVISNGQIVAEGPPSSLGGRDTDETIIEFRAPSSALPRSVAPLAVTEDERVRIQTPEPTRVLKDLTTWATRNKIELDDLRVARPTLEDVYLRLVGEEAQ
ncbi:MAG: ABC transporter ATP-binding protein [Actinomycetota bacterium]